MTHRIYGLILAGGKSSRMGTDKALLSYHGKTQAEFCGELLACCCEKVFLSIREDQAHQFHGLGIEQIHDIGKSCGPLTGILTAMQRYPKVRWFVVACDLPFLNEDICKKLITLSNPSKMATAYRGRYDGLPEPLCALYEPHAYSVLQGFIKKGTLCPRKILMNTDVCLLEQGPRNVLENINAPTERDAAKQRLRERCQTTVKKVHLQYYAQLKECSGVAAETYEGPAETPADLYEDLRTRYAFPIALDHIKVAVNDALVHHDAPLRNGDTVVFIPPVAGG